jgi:hypothetical protein
MINPENSNIVIEVFMSIYGSQDNSPRSNTEARWRFYPIKASRFMQDVRERHF